MPLTIIPDVVYCSRQINKLHFIGNTKILLTDCQFQHTKFNVANTFEGESVNQLIYCGIRYVAILDIIHILYIKGGTSVTHYSLKMLC